MTKQINTIKDVNVGDVFYYYEADTRYRKPRSVAVVAVDTKYITVDVGGGKYEQLEKFQINRTVSGFAVKAGNYSDAYLIESKDDYDFIAKWGSVRNIVGSYSSEANIDNTSQKAIYNILKSGGDVKWETMKKLCRW